MNVWKNFIDKLYMLNDLKIQAQSLHLIYGFIFLTLSDSQKYKFMEDYYSIVSQYHIEKYWFMSNLPTLGKGNKII